MEPIHSPSLRVIAVSVPRQLRLTLQFPAAPSSLANLRYYELPTIQNSPRKAPSMRLLTCLTALLSLSGMPVFAADISVEQYGYPLENPFEATIATTPAALRDRTSTRL